MASFSLSTLPTNTTKKTHTFSRSPLFSKTSSHRFRVSCNTSSDDNNKNSETSKLILPNMSLDTKNVDRRNVLLGLGGLYGAANLTTIPSASAVPIQAPDNIALCVNASDGIANKADALRGVACCPPLTSPQSYPEDYVLPTNPTMRTRPTAQQASNDPAYVKKYRDAMAAMRALPDDDPRSWKNQGKIHCAYCNGAFTQEKSGYDTLNLQIHNNWLFYPFHRWYLYFYERILGSLINDPTFALPYWNWDNPDGMAIPPMFEESVVNPNPVDPTNPGNPNPKFNSLFDGYRNPVNFVTAPGILNFARFNSTDPAVITEQNLYTMYNQMITGTSAFGFFGGKMAAGDNAGNEGGSIEAGVHTAVHIWTGNGRMGNNEDMGNFYSAGYDPVFYSHHSNVDRMWTIWKAQDPTNNKEPDFDDWKNASYVFYDENKNLVRVYNNDCVDPTNLGYQYADSPTPWTSYSPTAHAPESHIATESIGSVEKAEDTKFPVSLNKTVKLLVKRPAINRTNKEKASADEMLVLGGIQFDGTTSFKFDVLINDVDDGTKITAADSEFAGTFESLQHGLGGAMDMKSGARFGITRLLEDLKAEDDEYVLVTLLPIEGAEDVTVSDIKIELVPTLLG
ncbi:polyphenol oxidase I, chloroplastic-like protein [Tanacetum coccineum]